MKRIILLVALLALIGCKEVTQEVWNAVAGEEAEKQEMTAYHKSVQITASIDDATGDVELETAFFATGGSAVVRCSDDHDFDLLITFDDETRLYTFQRFEIVYDGQDCGLFVYFLGPWDPLQERYFYHSIEFSSEPIEKIFINFSEIIIE